MGIQWKNVLVFNWLICTLLTQKKKKPVHCDWMIGRKLTNFCYLIENDFGSFLSVLECLFNVSRLELGAAEYVEIGLF